MARIGRWSTSRPAADFPDGEGPAGLRSRHLLLLPTTVTPAEVGALIRSRVPDAALERDGEVRLGRHCRIHGPYELTMEDAVDAGVPMPWTLAYALDAPIEREDPPEPGHDDRDGFAHAFPDGLPWREEGRALHLLVGLARRLHGAVRVSGGALMHPDAERAVDVVIHSPTWLEPEVVHGIVARILPGAELAPRLEVPGKRVVVQERHRQERRDREQPTPTSATRSRCRRAAGHACPFRALPGGLLPQGARRTPHEPPVRCLAT